MDALKHVWRPATLGDMDAIIQLSANNFLSDVDQLFVVDPVACARNLTQAIVVQHYQPLHEMVSVAEDNQHNISAWTWARSLDVAPWSDQRMVMARMAAIDLALPPRQRVQLVRDMLALWEGFAQFAGVKIICSSSMRQDYSAFMRVHAQAGYVVRGSNAYKILP
jgi:hypothetical protein